MPTYPVRTWIGSPVCRPMRTRTVDTLRPFVSGQLALRFHHAADRIDGAREDGKERITLGVDLAAVPACESGSQDLSLLIQQNGVLLAQPLEQLGRTFDVGEEECNGSGRRFQIWRFALRWFLHTRRLMVTD